MPDGCAPGSEAGPAIKLYGGAGADAFVFATGDTAKGKVSADIIYDFRAGQGDVIDLTGYDANAKKFGNQDFDFQATIVSGGGNVAR